MQPATVVILLKEGDKLEVADDDDLHSSDTVQEKLSLVYRFGVRIYFGAPNKKEFQTIVKHWQSATALQCRRTSFWKQKVGAFPWRTYRKNCTAVYRSSSGVEKE